MKKCSLSWMATLVAIPVLFSCVEKELEFQKPQETTPVVEKTVYEYRFEIGEGETRAILQNDGVYWENNDPMGLFVKRGNSLAEPMDAQVSVQEDATPTVGFTTNSALDETASIYAYYPCVSSSTVDAARISFSRTQQGGSVSAMPLAGIPTQFQQGEHNGVIRFLNLGSVIDFRVYSNSNAGQQSERVKSVRISVLSGTNPISGEATLDLSGVEQGDESNLAVVWPEGASVASSVTLTQTADVAASIDDATPLYMVVAPGTYSGTIVIVTDVAIYTYDFSGQTFGRNVIRRFNMNLSSVKAHRNEKTTYQRIGSLDNLTSGEYLIVYEKEPTAAFLPILSGTNALVATADNVQPVTIEDNRISSTSAVEECRVVFESASQSKYYMKAVAEEDYYFYPTSNGIGATKNKNSATSVSISIDNSGVVNITAGSNNYFKYSTSSNCFKQSTYNSSRELALFKKTGADELVNQTLQFSAPSFTYCIDGQSLPVGHVSNAPVLMGAYTAVTYSSSNGSVVTVDASTGALTVQGVGNAVIMASAAADGDFNAASASYDVTVQQESIFNLENEKLFTYLNLVDANHYDPPSDYSFTHMTAELQSGNQDQVNRTDWPRPVPLNWSNPASGNASKKVNIYNCTYNGSEMIVGSLELSVPVSSSTATSTLVYNLIPKRNYYYEVVDENDEDHLIAEGTFRTDGRRRMIKVGDSPYGQAYSNNCRDFGGQITQDGRRIKFGKMFRGSNMDLITDEQRSFLLDYMKIGLDVDLRRSDGNDVAGAGNNKLYNALELDDYWHTTQSFNGWGDFANLIDGKYQMTTILTKVFEAVAANKGVYVHCMVGADRTGYVCMLLEAILGVEQGWCDVDYELTSFSGAVDKGIGRWRVGAYSSGGKTLSNNWYYRTRGNTTQGVDFIYELSVGDYGTVYPNNSFQAKAVNYVVNTFGIPFADIQTFQNNMLEENN